jgi:hypothetical protein
MTRRYEPCSAVTDGPWPEWKRCGKPVARKDIKNGIARCPEHPFKQIWPTAAQDAQGCAQCEHCHGTGIEPGATEEEIVTLDFVANCRTCDGSGELAK